MQMINVKLIRTVWSFTNTISYTNVEISNTNVEISNTNVEISLPYYKSQLIWIKKFRHGIKIKWQENGWFLQAPPIGRMW